MPKSAFAQKEKNNLTAWERRQPCLPFAEQMEKLSLATSSEFSMHFSLAQASEQTRLPALPAKKLIDFLKEQDDLTDFYC